MNKCNIRDQNIEALSSVCIYTFCYYLNRTTIILYVTIYASKRWACSDAIDYSVIEMIHVMYTWVFLVVLHYKHST